MNLSIPSFFLFQLAFLVWAAILCWQLGIAISHCVFSPICMSGSFSDSSSSIRCVIYRTVLSPVSSGPLVEYRLSSFSSSSPFLSCRRHHHFSAAHFSKKPTGNSVRLVGAVEVGNMQAGRQAGREGGMSNGAARCSSGGQPSAIGEEGGKEGEERVRESEMRSWYKNGRPAKKWRHFKQRCLLFRSKHIR